ncbi:MAG: GGDEF domain-containing protein [Paraglaciecola sp.]|uniref:GGDEF domain-containing protein n=1 Tax=Paraglaciecola sp. TaxID=1920173 RepID=UPI00273D9F84|nr:GGDEF domain-containing protein [Paraglaciecola sp.]MDP5033176.1 GGDEF domain-containing protein [Paraglaciecola sp.]MDP5133907.1 GGDEF domain-containing protein [Paraglaciecola sp.]
MSDKNFEMSFSNLKQTIPLLIKHKVAALPINYALWYTYVSNEVPELNLALEGVIKQERPITEAKTKELYRQYLSESQEVTAWELRQSMEAMLIELTQSITDTRSETNGFKITMDNCVDNLTKVEKEGLSIEEVMALVRNLVKETQNIRRSTMSFNSALAEAQTEISALRSQLEKSQQEALYDALTGLSNRRYFDEELASHAVHPNLFLILVDLDHFKKINDNYGHVMGDLVLKAAAKKIQACCRDSAQAFRFGGEEFAIIVPNSTFAKTRSLAETMRRSMEKIAVKDKRTGEVLGDITASFGIAELRKGMNPLVLVESADKQLYEAKRLGRNRVMPIM